MKRGIYKPLSLPIYWLGTKVRMRDKILPIIGRFKRKLYVEPFGGACGMLFGKQPEKCEVYNDANELLTNLFTVLRNPNNIETLDKLLSVSPIGRSMFHQLKELMYAWKALDRGEFIRRKKEQQLEGYPDEIAVAYAFFYCMNGCYRGRISGGRATFAGGQKGDCSDNTVRAYYKARTSLPLFADRLQCVCIENLDYKECIKKYDAKDTFFYLDPPYAVELSKGYATGWSESDECELVDLLACLKGNFVLSCYDTPQYERLLEHGATRETFDAFSTIAQHGGGEASKRVETVYWRGGRTITKQISLWDWLKVEA